MKIKSYEMYNYPPANSIHIKNLILVDNKGTTYKCDEIATDKKYIYWNKDGINYTDSKLDININNQLLFENDNGYGYVFYDETPGILAYDIAGGKYVKIDPFVCPICNSYLTDTNIYK